MAIAGIGVAPPAGSAFNELSAVVQRAFVRKLFVQMYYASPTLFFLWGNAQRAAGGLNQITIPMQGQSMVQGQFTNYGGGFNAPVVTPGIQNGQWNLAFWVVPVPLPFGETVIQATDTVVSLLKARMNDVYATTRQNVARLLFQSSSANNPTYPNSLNDAFDNGSNLPVYGGINRTSAGNANFKGQYINAGTGTTWNTNFTTATTGWNRKAMSALLTYITSQAGGEAPTFLVMNPADYSTLNNDIIGAEQVNIRPSGGYGMGTDVRSSFPNINIAGVPIFADYFCPVGNMFAANVKYTTMYISEDAAMDWSGFHSLVPLGQIGQQGIMALGYNLVSAKSSSGAWVYGFGGNSF
jgi:hypothetical protein